MAEMHVRKTFIMILFYNKQRYIQLTYNPPRDNPSQIDWSNLLDNLNGHNQTYSKTIITLRVSPSMSTSPTVNMTVKLPDEVKLPGGKNIEVNTLSNTWVSSEGVIHPDSLLKNLPKHTNNLQKKENGTTKNNEDGMNIVLRQHNDATGPWMSNGLMSRIKEHAKEQANEQAKKVSTKRGQPVRGQRPGDLMLRIHEKAKAKDGPSNESGQSVRGMPSSPGQLPGLPSKKSPNAKKNKVVNADVVTNSMNVEQEGDSGNDRLNLKPLVKQAFGITPMDETTPPSPASSLEPILKNTVPPSKPSWATRVDRTRKILVKDTTKDRVPVRRVSANGIPPSPKKLLRSTTLGGYKRMHP